MAKIVSKGLIKSRHKELKGLKPTFKLSSWYTDVYVLGNTLYIRQADMYSAWLVYKLKENNCTDLHKSLGYILSVCWASNGELIRANTKKGAYGLAWEIAFELRKLGYLEFIYPQIILKDIIQEEVSHVLT